MEKKDCNCTKDINDLPSGVTPQVCKCEEGFLKKESNLSDKIFEARDIADGIYEEVLKVEDVKEFVKGLKEKKIDFTIVHRNTCGEPIRGNDGRVIISCGESLDSCGDSNEYAQCSRCRINDFIDHEAGVNLR